MCTRSCLLPGSESTWMCSGYGLSSGQPWPLTTHLPLTKPPNSYGASLSPSLRHNKKRMRCLPLQWRAQDQMTALCCRRSQLAVMQAVWKLLVQKMQTQLHGTMPRHALHAGRHCSIVSWLPNTNMPMCVVFVHTTLMHTTLMHPCFMYCTCIFSHTGVGAHDSGHAGAWSGGRPVQPLHLTATVCTPGTQSVCAAAAHSTAHWQRQQAYW